MEPWPFADPPNVAVFTSWRILDGKEWISYVAHDEEDGAWQFLPKSGASMEEAALVLLKEIVDRDPSVKSLADLPFGWCAWREEKDQPWQRTKKE